jgi:hypothetical protein
LGVQEKGRLNRYATIFPQYGNGGVGLRIDGRKGIRDKHAGLGC